MTFADSWADSSDTLPMQGSREFFRKAKLGPEQQQYVAIWFLDLNKSKIETCSHFGISVEEFHRCVLTEAMRRKRCGEEMRQPRGLPPAEERPAAPVAPPAEIGRAHV